jgi:polysaccharide pyruvyl transferase WcaK-like protein
MFWRPVYRGGLVGSDVVVIGGGNLLTDIDLNFPKKLAAVLDESARRKLPVHIFAVGVANVWSPAGLRILRRAFSMARIESVCVRDEESRLNFNRLFADSSGREALLARDPGLLISRYRDKALKSGSREIVGLCLTSAIAVRYHSKQTVSDQYLIRWYIEVAVHLARAGYAVRPFTTGSPEDVGFAEPIIAKIGGMAGVVDAQLRPGQPSSLADVVSNCNLIIAFRMHALIAASSYGVPVLALRWDPKVDSFMNSLGNSGNVFDVQNLRPTKIVQVARRIIAQELDSRAAAPVFVAAAYADVLGLLDRIRHIDPVNEG